MEEYKTARYYDRDESAEEDEIAKELLQGPEWLLKIKEYCEKSTIDKERYLRTD